MTQLESSPSPYPSPLTSHLSPLTLTLTLTLTQVLPQPHYGYGGEWPSFDSFGGASTGMWPLTLPARLRPVAY